jgi:hypothetical protein
MTETYAEQRDRIITNTLIDPDTFDVIFALGYEPESWDGMWKLPEDPIAYRGLGIVILREVIYKPGTHDATYDPKTYKVRTRIRLRRDPLA